MAQHFRISANIFCDLAWLHTGMRTAAKCVGKWKSKSCSSEKDRHRKEPKPRQIRTGQTTPLNVSKEPANRSDCPANFTNKGPVSPSVKSCPFSSDTGEEPMSESKQNVWWWYRLGKWCLALIVLFIVWRSTEGARGNGLCVAPTLFALPFIFRGLGIIPSEQPLQSESAGVTVRTPKRRSKSKQKRRTPMAKSVSETMGNLDTSKKEMDQKGLFKTGSSRE